MPYITLMRHSITDANEEGIYDSGTHDAELSENGILLALEKASELELCPDAIYPSDMNRTMQTAQVYALAFTEQFGLDVPIIPVEKLRAQDHGTLEGLAISSPLFQLIRENAREMMGGEMDWEAERRQKAGILDVIAEMEKRGYQHGLIITHGDVITRFLKAIGDKLYDPHNIDNCQMIGPFNTEMVAEKLAPPKKTGGFKPKP